MMDLEREIYADGASRDEGRGSQGRLRLSCTKLRPNVRQGKVHEMDGCGEVAEKLESS